MEKRLSREFRYQRFVDVGHRLVRIMASLDYEIRPIAAEVGMLEGMVALAVLYGSEIRDR